MSPEPDARVLDARMRRRANLAQFLKLCPKGMSAGSIFHESVATSLRKNAGAVAAGRCNAAGGCFPAALCRCVPSISSPLSRRSTSGRMCPPPLQRCTAYSRTVRRVFDRERGVRDSRWCAIVDGMRTYTADSLAEWLRSSDLPMSGPMFAERAGRCALPQRKARILPVSGPRRREATHGAIHPEEPGMLARKP